MNADTWPPRPPDDIEGRLENVSVTDTEAAADVPNVNEELLVSSVFITDRLEPARRRLCVSFTVKALGMKSRLQREVWDALRDGTGAGGGPSTEFSSSIKMSTSS